jgi:predicted TIM-barrel fold metal-dependent hydrolase
MRLQTSLLHATRNDDLAAQAESHQARHLRELRAQRAADADDALARREWRALFRALRAR